MKLCSLDIHKWSKWTDPYRLWGFYWKQQRTCKSCNRTDSRLCGPPEPLKEKEDV